MEERKSLLNMIIDNTAAKYENKISELEKIVDNLATQANAVTQRSVIGNIFSVLSEFLGVLHV